MGTAKLSENRTGKGDITLKLCKYIKPSPENSLKLLFPANGIYQGGECCISSCLHTSFRKYLKWKIEGNIATFWSKLEKSCIH